MSGLKNVQNTKGEYIKLNEILSGKNINFLIGSGAGVPFYKTLFLGENKPSFEELLSSDDIDSNNKKILYYFYYKEWILPMTEIVTQKNLLEPQKNVISNYNIFIKKLLLFLKNESNEKPKRVNIFTTNYDLLFEKTFQDILNEKFNCYFNDGSIGFMNRTLNAQNFNLTVNRTGYLDKYKNEVPTINLIKMHGSISWQKIDNNFIEVKYLKDNPISTISSFDAIDFVRDIVNLIKENDYSDFNKKLSELYKSNESEINNFYDNYKKLAIINPDKWKFYETVFEQHYYQQLRNFSYELEKEHTILIVFGFSFADEHIQEVFERALTNPELEVFIICYNEKTLKQLQDKFLGNNNIKYLPNPIITQDGHRIVGNFSYFNSLLEGDKNE